MTSDITISVNNLSKIYKLYNSPVDRVKESLHPLRRECHHKFYALNDVSFEVRKGDAIGIIGKNGSGKSTLLKILTGIITPSSGYVTVRGKVSALLELGAGFNPELTGIENIYFNGLLMGISRDEMDLRLDEIIKFADIGEFIGQQVKIYSSGMFVRLAFAVGISVCPDILIVDEALSVGDVQFQQKCIAKIEDFRGAGGTLVFVSHDMNAVRLLCNKVIYMESGEIYELGDPINVIDIYQARMFQEHFNNQSALILNKGAGNKNPLELNTGEIKLLSTKLYNETGKETNYIVSETDMEIEFSVHSYKCFGDPHYGFHIRDKYGVSVFETNSYCMGMRLKPLHGNQDVVISIRLNCNLPPADYTLSFGFGNKGFGRGMFEEGICLIHNVITFTVVGNDKSIVYSGHTNLRPKMECRYS